MLLLFARLFLIVLSLPADILRLFCLIWPRSDLPYEHTTVTSPGDTDQPQERGIGAMSTTVGSFVAGGIAACGAVTVTHSFETVKIRLQLQGELQTKKEAPRLYRGVLHGVSVIFKNEGAKGLLRGLSCAVGPP